MAENWLKGLIPDRIVVERQYRRKLGRKPDLDRPKGLHEKICWLRLNRLTPLHSYCADKLTVAAYVASVLGEARTAPRYLRTADPERLSAAAIPASRCIIKTNHGSGGVIAVQDTAAADWPAIRHALHQLLRLRYDRKFRERQYRPIRPMVLAEKWVDQTDLHCGEVNFYCLNGVARFALAFQPGAVLASQKGVVIGRDGQRLPVSRQIRATAQTDIPVPPRFAEMRDMAERLARPFPLVRMDFLLDRDGFHVSEMTFTPLAGYETFVPESFEQEMGALLDHQAEMPDWRPILDAARVWEDRVLPPLL